MEKITFNVSEEQEKWLEAVRWKYRAPISQILRHILDHEMENPAWLDPSTEPSAPSTQAVANE